MPPESATTAIAPISQAATSSLSLRLKYFAANLLLIWLAILLFRTNHYYLRFFSDQTQTLLLWLATAYTIIGLPWYWLRRDLLPSRAYIALTALRQRLTQTR